MADDFRYFKLGLASRLVAAGGAFAIGIALELAVGAGSFFPGILVVAAGWLPLMLRRATNKPDEQGLEEWRPVPMSEVDRLDDGLRESAKLRKRTRSVSARLALGLGIPAFLVFFGIAAATGRTDLSFIGGNAAVLLVPSILFGRVKVYTPSVIAMKMPAFAPSSPSGWPTGSPSRLTSASTRTSPEPTYPRTSASCTSSSAPRPTSSASRCRLPSTRARTEPCRICMRSS
jgi:hypothetical protein